MALCSLCSSCLNLRSADALVLVSVKVQEARKFPDIKIVSFDWLTASVDNQIRADEAHFSFGELGSDQDDGPRSTSPMPPIQKDTKGKGRKRPRTPALIEEDESHYIETPAEWRQKKRYREMQRAKSGSILIPVDEACPLAGNTSDRKPFRD